MYTRRPFLVINKFIAITIRVYYFVNKEQTKGKRGILYTSRSYLVINNYINSTGLIILFVRLGGETWRGYCIHQGPI